MQKEGEEEGDMKIDLKEMGCEDGKWMELAKIVLQWWY